MRSDYGTLLMPSPDDVENIIASIEARAEDFDRSIESIEFGSDDGIFTKGCRIGQGKDSVRVLASEEWDHIKFRHKILLDSYVAIKNNPDFSDGDRISKEELENAQKQLKESLAELDEFPLQETYLRLLEIANAGDCELTIETLDSYQVYRCMAQKRTFVYNEPMTTSKIWNTFRSVRQCGWSIREVLLAKYPLIQSTEAGGQQEPQTGPAFQ